MKKIFFIYILFSLSFVSYSQVVINELGISPSVNDGSIYGPGPNGGLGGGEWIELYNTDLCNSVDISNYVIGTYNWGDGEGTAFVFPSGLSISAGGYAIVRGANVSPPPAGVTDIVITGGSNQCIEDLIYGNGRMWFQNSGGWIGLYDNVGTTLDMAKWGSPLSFDLSSSPCIPSSNGGISSLGTYNSFAGAVNISSSTSATGKTFVRLPDGGTWSSTQVSENTSFGSSNQPTTATISYSGSPWCVTEGNKSVTLTGAGNYTGGTYSSTSGLSINSSNGTIDVSSSTPGTYTVSYILSNYSCTGVAATANVEITGEPSAPTATLTQSTCSIATGQIDVTAPTGNGETYSIDGTTFQSSTSFASLSPNNYTVTVKNSDGCTNTASFTIDVAPTTPTTPTATLTDPTCSITTGQIDITAPTGNGETYSIDGTTFQSGTSFTSLTPNNYTITVKNSDGCTNTASFTISAPPGAPAAPTATLIQPTCSVATGQIDISAPIGNGETYSIDGTTFQSGTSFTSLTPNNYTVTVKNSDGCTNTASFTINVAPTTPTTPTATLTQPTCSVGTGQIDVSSPTGNGETYSIDGTTFQSSTLFTSLAPNNYTVTIKNNDGCTNTASFTINVAPTTPATPTATLTDPTCSITTGQIDISAPNGNGETYSIDGTTFQSGTSFTSLTPNNYTITVKNSDGCTNTASFTISAPPGAPAAPTATLIQPTCSFATGQIDISAPIGNGETYSIDGTTFQSGTSFTSLTPNNYTVTVKNSDGCTNTASFTINVAPTTPTTPTATLTQPTCSVGTGQIDLSSPTGNGETYSIDGTTFQSSSTFTSLTPNNYTVTVKNSDGCTNTASFTISAPPGAPAAPNATLIQPTCSVATGQIDISAPIGNGETYSIDGTTFQSGTSFTSLTPNNYTVTVKNSDGCTNTASFTINVAPTTPTTPTATLTQPTCSVGTGQIDVSSPTGNGETYSIDGTTFQSSSTFTSLTPNNYTVTVKNSDGCTNTASFTISAPPGAPAAPTATLIQPTCSVATGQIDISAPIGNGETYSIDGTTFQSGTSFTSLIPNNYTITVKNSDGCTNTASFTINNAPIGPVSPSISCGTATTTSITFDWTIPSGATDFNVAYSVNGGSSVNIGSTTSNSYTVTGLSINSQVEITINTNGSECYDAATQICVSDDCTPSVANFSFEPTTVTSLNPVCEFTNLSENSIGYIWDFGDENSSTDENPSNEYVIGGEGKYNVILIAINEDGCNDTIIKKVSVREEIIYYVPNAFTPDGDKFNNEFKPVFYSGIDLQSYTMLIFNRYGQLVFETHDVDKGWKGFYGESDVMSQDGVYTYKIDFKHTLEDDVEIITGTVLLMR